MASDRSSHRRSMQLTSEERTVLAVLRRVPPGTRRMLLRVIAETGRLRGLDSNPRRGLRRSTVTRAVTLDRR